MSFDEANTVAALIGARRQSWSWLRDGASLAAITAPNGPPTGSDVVDLVQRIRGSLIVACRLDPRWREATVSIEVYDATADYTIELDYLSASSGTAHTDEGELLEALRDAINGLAGAPYIATIVGDALRIRGASAEDYAIRWSATATGELSIVADAVGGEVAVWAQPDGDDDQPDGVRRWAQLARQVIGDRRGQVAELRTPARRAGYVEVVRIARHESDGLDVVPRLVAGFGRGRN